MLRESYTQVSKRTPREQCVDEELPYLQTLSEEYGGGWFVLLKDGAFLAGLDVSLKPWETLTDDDMNRESTALHEALRSLREGVEIQLEVVRGPVRTLRFPACQSRDPRVLELLEERKQFLKRHRGVLENRVTIYLCWSPERRQPGATGWLGRVLRPRAVMRNFRLQEHKAALREFEGHLNELRSALAGAGITADLLDDQQLIDRIREALNPGVGVRESKVQPFEYVSDRVTEGEVVLARREFEIGEQKVRVLSIKTLPDEIHPFQLRALARLPFSSRIVLGTKLENQERALEKQQGAYKRSHALINGVSIGRGQSARDIGAENKAHAHEEVVQKMMQGWQLMPTSLEVVVWAKSEELLDERELAVRAAWSQNLRGSRPLTEGVSAWEVFRGTLPGNQSSLGRTFLLLSPKVAALASGLTAGVASRGYVGDLTFVTRERGFWPFEMFSQSQNVTGRVMIVFAETGSGKSFFVCQIVIGELPHRPIVHIMDRGRSFEQLARSMGGITRVYDVDNDRSESINPLNVRTLNRMALQYILGFLSSSIFCKTKEEGLDRVVEGLVGEEVTRLFAGREDGQELILSDLERALLRHDDPRVVDLGKRLKIATTGPYGRLLNQRTGRRDDQYDIVYHDFARTAKDPRLADALMYLTAYGVYEMSQLDPSRRKLFILDEAWSALRPGSTGAALAEEMARTGRKLNLAPVFISQDLKSMSQGSLREGILEQAAYQVILRSGQLPIQEVADIFRLNEAEQNLVDSLRTRVGEYSEAFLMTPHGRGVVRLQVPPLHYWLATTDPPDTVERERAFERFDGDEWTALRWLASTYPKGVRASEAAKASTSRAPRPMQEVA